MVTPDGPDGHDDAAPDRSGPVAAGGAGDGPEPQGAAAPDDATVGVGVDPGAGAHGSQARRADAVSDADGVDVAEAGDGTPGHRILVFDRWTTIVFAVVSVAAAALPDPFELVAVPVSLALFLIGSGAFLWAYLVAISRSRFVEISVGGAFFLAGDVAPRDVARTLRVLLGVQIVVAVAVAAVRPFTALAAGVLAPMSGLGMMALWGSYHGAFPPKADTPTGDPGLTTDAAGDPGNDTGAGAPDEAPPSAQ